MSYQLFECVSLARCRPTGGGVLKVKMVRNVRQCESTKFILLNCHVVTIITLSSQCRRRWDEIFLCANCHSIIQNRIGTVLSNCFFVSGAKLKLALQFYITFHKNMGIIDECFSRDGRNLHRFSQMPTNWAITEMILIAHLVN